MPMHVQIDWRAPMMKFGIESEFFVECLSGARCPSLDLASAIFERLSESSSWSVEIDAATGFTVGANLYSNHGLVKIKNDFSTNIVEIAYPPVATPQAFRELHLKVIQRLHPILNSFGVKVTRGTVGDFDTSQIVLRPAPDDEYRQRLSFDTNRVDNGRPLFNRFFFANVCSTQVSLSIDRPEWYRIAAALYKYECLIPLLFSTPETASGVTRHCLRHFIFQDNWPGDPYVGFPEDVSGLIATVRAPIESANLKFANCISRDPYRVEFRSCDRLDNVEAILEMVLLRFAVYFAAQSGNEKQELKKHAHARLVFEDICANGFSHLDTCGFPDLKPATKNLSGCWTDVQQNLERRISRTLNLA